MSNIPKKPTHRLVIRVKNADGTMGKNRGDLGRAWQNDDNSFTIHLNAGTSLRWTDPVAIGLFPLDKPERLGDE